MDILIEVVVNGLPSLIEIGAGTGRIEFRMMTLCGLRRVLDICSRNVEQECFLISRHIKSNLTKGVNPDPRNTNVSIVSKCGGP